MSDRTVTLVGSDGSRHTLVCAPSGPYELKDGRLWGLAPYTVTSQTVGLIPGRRLDQVQARPRTLAVPVLVSSNGEQQLDERLGDLGGILTPRADVRIIYERPDGTEREIVARYVSGGDAVEVVHRKQRYVKVPLVFTAFWPYWRAVANDIATYGYEQFNDGGFAGSNDVTVVNDGDVDTWPEFTIAGHAENIEALHLPSGKVWRVTEEIGAGETLRINTDPRSFGVWINELYQFDAVDEISQFWALRPGANRFIIRANSNFVSTIGSFSVRWRPHYETC